MMNDQIKTILEKNNIAMINDVWVVTKMDLSNAIIEICEEQKRQCDLELKDNHYSKVLPSYLILNAKNIAETETDLSTETKK